MILSKYKEMHERVIDTPFFKDFLSENEARYLSIIFDDNNCFTEQSRKSALSGCDLGDKKIDFDNLVFISLEDEYGVISRWGLLPDGQYFSWYNGFLPPSKHIQSYLKCK
ncbi:MAG: hypothetical protein AAF573_06820 [Bacteroidota bacterium]